MKVSLFAAIWYAGVAAGKSAGAAAKVVPSDVSSSLSTSSLLSSNIKLDIHPTHRGLMKMNGALSGLVGSGETTAGTASFSGRQRHLEEEGGTNPDTNNKEEAITGEMFIFGYRNGTLPSGTKNQTLEIQFQGFSSDEIEACSKGSCTVELNDNANSCDDSNDSEETRVILVENLVKAASEIGYIDVGRNVEELFDLPISIHDSNGTVLACAIFTEIEDTSPDTAAADSPSGAMGSTVDLTALFVFVSSFVGSVVLSL